MKKFIFLLACLNYAVFSQNLVWDGSNPFYQPSHTSLYWGSGDANGDGIVNQADVTTTQQMVNGVAPKNIRSDANGDGVIDSYDINLIQNAVNNVAPLPGWWNYMTTRNQRNAWITSMLSHDITNLHPYDNNYFVCNQFSAQLYINFTGYREDLFSTPYNGGKTFFNIPMYTVTIASSTFGHNIDAILVGDNPLNSADWRFIEPQGDYDVTPGAWNMPYGCQVTIDAPLLISRGGFSNSTINVVFNVDNNGILQYVSSSGILTTRPYIPTITSNNRYDYWNPTILPISNGKVAIEGVSNDSNHNTSMFISVFPTTNPVTATSINYVTKNFRILDIKKNTNGNINVLWKESSYSPIIREGILDTMTYTFTNINTVVNQGTDFPCGKLIIKSISQKYAFWADYTNPTATIYWSFFNGSSWSSPTSIATMSFISDPIFVENHEWKRYAFDAIILPNNNLGLVYIDQYSSNTISNMKYIVYDFNSSTWSSATTIESGAIRGAQLTTTSDGYTHLLYWLGQNSWSIGCERGNLLYRNYLTSWSNSQIIDSSNAASCVKATTLGSKFAAVWERTNANSTFPILGIYNNGAWTKRVVSSDATYSSWYPSIGSLPNGHLAVAWSSRNDSIVTVGTYDTIVSSSCTNVSISSNPANSTVSAGSSASFTIQATGATPSYQWQKSTDGGTNFLNVTDGSGGTTTGYTTPLTTSSMNGYRYRCNVSNTCPSSVLSSNAILTVGGVNNLLANPGFESGTASWTINDSRFSISTADKHTGTNSLKLIVTSVAWKNCSQIISVSANTNYTTSVWLKGTANVGVKVMNTSWVDIINQTFTVTGTWTQYSYTFNSGSNTSVIVDIQDQGVGTSYIDDISITGPGGTCTNVSIGSQPSNAVVSVGNTATFTVSANGTTPSYQWQKSTDGGTNFLNVTDGSGGTTASYTTPTTTSAMNGYKYRGSVSNTCPSNTISNTATLTVNSCTSVSISTQPSNATVTSGNTATFITSATGTSPSYQWQKSTDNGTNYINVSDGTGGTTTIYTTPATTTAMNGYKYRCYASNTCPSNITSNSASLTISGITNLIANPGFESGTTSWNIDDSRFALSTADKHTGTNSMKLTVTSVAWKNCRQTITVSTNTNYTVTLWLKGAGLQVAIWTPSWGQIKQQSFTATGSWAQYTTTFNSGSNSSIMFDLQDNVTGTTYIDDIVVSK